MRDWNKQVAEQLNGDDEFWSYLWGIETENKQQRSKHYQRFDLTYEGLKQMNEEKTNKNKDCFDLTYEGLKHGMGKRGNRK